MVYVNDEQEGKFLWEETITLLCCKSTTPTATIAAIIKIIKNTLIVATMLLGLFFVFLFREVILKYQPVSPFFNKK